METGKTINADQLAETYRRYPIDDHGKLRYCAFKVSALTVALAANDTIGLLWLPPGRKRLLPYESRLTVSAFGASRTLDVGHDAYSARSPGSGVVEAANPDAFIDGLDVATAVTASLWTPANSALWYDMYSHDETLVYATVLGGTMPIGATMSGYLAYLYE